MKQKKPFVTLIAFNKGNTFNKIIGVIQNMNKYLI
jgi:hypothetical protein